MANHMDDKDKNKTPSEKTDYFGLNDDLTFDTFEEHPKKADVPKTQVGASSQSPKKKTAGKIPAFSTFNRPSVEKHPLPVSGTKGKAAAIRKLLMEILLGIVLILVIVIIVLTNMKASVKKDLTAETDKNATLTKQVEELQQKIDNSPLAGYSKEDLESDFPYTALYPELMVTSINPSDIDTSKRVVYLSFDDGPSKLTAGILDVLKEQGIKATFFVTGYEIDTYADVLKRAVEEGHTIGIHTNMHKYDDIYASVDAYLEDFNTIWTKVKEITGTGPNIFRFPGGSINAHNRSIYQRLIAEMMRRGFTYYDWNVDTQDATSSPSPEKMMENINAQIEKATLHAPVILMHDTKQVTADTIKQIIEAYKTAGYEFGTLDQRPACYFPYTIPKSE